MSCRARQQQPVPAAASSRRTRRAELLLPRPSAATGLAETPQIVSNPIFRCEAGAGPSQPNRAPPGDQLRCVYRPGSLYALVHDPAASASAGSATGIGNGKAQQPLPLPPCRAHPSGRVGPARGVGGPHPHGSRVLRRAATHDDPFLAAYVACSKSAGGKDTAGADDRRQHKEKRGRRKTKKKATGKKCKVMFRGCGIWSGWTAAGAKYAGAMSCRYGCAVAAQKGDARATATKSEDDAPPAGPTLDLSWTPALLSARKLERREQRCR